MNRKRLSLIVAILSLVILLVSFGVVAAEKSFTPIEERGYAAPDNLISAEQLKEIKSRDDVVVIDFRSKVKYHTGHIPGAIQISRDEFENPQAAYNFFKATPKQIEEVLSNKGVDNDDLIVAYDATNDLWAVRVWWILKMYGHDQVKLLDGGLNRWKSLGYDLNRVGSPDIEKTDYEVEEVNDYMVASAQEVKTAIDNQNAVILDTRAWGEYTGDKVLSGAAAGGRIPNSVWIEWTEALNKNGTFKSTQQLAKIYLAKGINSDRDVIIPYCQGAIRSAHTTFVLRALLGLDNVENYDGSWVEWSNEDFPIEQGIKVLNK